MKTKINIDTWERREHFNFFNNFDEPFYGVCIIVDCTIAYQFAKQNNISFFLYSIYQCLNASHMIEAFKMRIEGEDVVVYDQINAASTVARANDTFGYGYYQYYPTLAEFITEANKEVAKVQGRTDLVRLPATNTIRFSSLPWINFTSLSHASMFGTKDSAPRISFGKITTENGKRTMPLSIHVSHALVDGLHLGRYLETLQDLLNKTE